MDRRRFLQSGFAAAAAGLAGCPGGEGDSTPTDDGETAAPTATGTDATGVTEAETATAAPTATDAGADLPRLQTDGNWIVTEDGERFTPRGANLVEPLFGHRNAKKRGGTYVDTLEMATDTSRAWYNDVLRIPVTQWGIEQLGFEEYARRFLDATVEHCREAGVYVILDYHIIKDWNDEAVHESVNAFWEKAAPRYAGEPHVLYEFFNEPVNPADDTLENWNAWKDVAQPMVDRIRERAPDTPIIVGSPGWTSLTKWAAESPFEGENLIYAGHVYPGDGKSAEELDPDYGEPADEVPVMITEWGFDGIDDVQPGTRSTFGEPFKRWLSGRENVGWTAWCLDSHWHPTMLDYDHDVTGGEIYHGHFVKQWLAETKSRNVPDGLVRDGAEYEGPSDESPPPMPSNASLTANDDGTVTLEWDQVVDADSSVLHYDVFVDGEARQHVDTIGPYNEAENGFRAEDLRFSTTLQGFTPGDSYDVYVTAVDALSNESAPSQILTHEVSGEVDVAAEIPKADSAPTVDGDLDGSWSDLTRRPFRHAVVGEIESDSDLGGGWRARWAAAALAPPVAFVDDERSVDSEAKYHDDTIEVYVDADYSHTPSYDGTNDYQIVIPRGSDRVFAGQLPNELSPEMAWTETDDGYHLEAAFPWDQLAPERTVEAGTLVGFDVHVNDDDDGGDRDGKLNWYNEQDDSWKNPAAFAAVKLVE